MILLFLPRGHGQDLAPRRTPSLPREMLAKWPGPVKFRIAVTKRRPPWAWSTVPFGWTVRPTASVILPFRVILPSSMSPFSVCWSCGGFGTWPRVLSGRVCRQKPVSKMCDEASRSPRLPLACGHLPSDAPPGRRSAQGPQQAGLILWWSLTHLCPSPGDRFTGSDARKSSLFPSTRFPSGPEAGIASRPWRSRALRICDLAHLLLPVPPSWTQAGVCPRDAGGTARLGAWVTRPFSRLRVGTRGSGCWALSPGQAAPGGDTEPSFCGASSCLKGHEHDTCHPTGRACQNSRFGIGPLDSCRNLQGEGYDLRVWPPASHRCGLSWVDRAGGT